ncbi:hypothetical protein LJR164_000724 [Phenylobacterium sp. LjRoot164]|uniref:hypothetical protein n=1 Tax=unclassified Phenylobacterium TaxID=2640670 RepID=UPI003ECE87D2
MVGQRDHGCRGGEAQFTNFNQNNNSYSIFRRARRQELIFDRRLSYSSTVGTSAGSNSIVTAGNIGRQFSKAFTLTGGYTGVPGSRSLVNTFPFFQSIDRTMARLCRQRPQYAEHLGGQDRRESDGGRQRLV